MVWPVPSAGASLASAFESSAIESPVPASVPMEPSTDPIVLELPPEAAMPEVAELSMPDPPSIAMPSAPPPPSGTSCCRSVVAEEQEAMSAASPNRNEVAELNQDSFAHLVQGAAQRVGRSE